MKLSNMESDSMRGVEAQILAYLAEAGENSKWGIKKGLGARYSSVHKAIPRLMKKGLIKCTRRERADKNPQLMVEYYWLTEKGILLAFAHHADRELLKHNILKYYGREKADEFEMLCGLEKILPWEVVHSLLITVTSRKKASITNVSNWLSLLTTLSDEEFAKFSELLERHPRIKQKVEEIKKIIFEKFSELFPAPEAEKDD